MIMRGMQDVRLDAPKPVAVAAAARAGLQHEPSPWRRASLGLRWLQVLGFNGSNPTHTPTTLTPVLQDRQQWPTPSYGTRKVPDKIKLHSRIKLTFTNSTI